MNNLCECPTTGGLPRSATQSDGYAGVKRQTVLVVEDERSVRDLIHKVLEREGLTVLQTATGEDALRYFRQYQGEIDLLIADLTLPSGSGIDIALQLRFLRPSLPVLLMSGYPVLMWTEEQAVLTTELTSRFGAVLLKPFLPAALLLAVAGLIQ